jgi:hypothetical protein
MKLKKDVFHAQNRIKKNAIADLVKDARKFRGDAAKQKGIGEVPCWVRDDLDEDGAFMLLATDNNQGELSPLEKGIHFNQSGLGVREYARIAGRTHAGIVYESQAGKVVSQLTTPAKELFSKTQHLSAIHSLPESLWQSAVDLMLKKEWSAAETQILVVPLEPIGRGQKGGLSEYARAIGKKHNTISEYKNAAAVAVKVSLKRHLLLDKAKHLSLWQRRRRGSGRLVGNMVEDKKRFRNRFLNLFKTTRLETKPEPVQMNQGSKTLQPQAIPKKSNRGSNKTKQGSGICDLKLRT